jgi:hypothetical protein
VRSRCPAGSTEKPQAESSERPLRRRADRMARPARVRMRRRKPWVLARRRLFGWKVRLLTSVLRNWSGPGGLMSAGGRPDQPQSEARARLRTSITGMRKRPTGRRLRYASASHRVKPDQTSRHTGPAVGSISSARGLDREDTPHYYGYFGHGPVIFRRFGCWPHPQLLASVLVSLAPPTGCG